MLKNATFETSVFSKDKIIDTDKKQIILVGKSNVGKSSFINAICNKKKMAKVGNTPGKTKCLNYYNINDEFYIVDLPGYGFSHMSKQEKENINKLTDYFLTNKKIDYIFFIVDIRYNPTKEDKIMYEYLLRFDVPFTIIANKADKVAKTKIDDYTMNITKCLLAKESIVPFSSESKLNVLLVENIVSDVVYKG